MRRFIAIFLILWSFEGSAKAASVEVNLGVLDQLRAPVREVPRASAAPLTPEPRYVFRPKPETPPLPQKQQAAKVSANSSDVPPPGRKPSQTSAPSPKVAKAPVEDVTVEILHKPQTTDTAGLETASIEPASGTQVMTLSLAFEPSQLSLGQDQKAALNEDQISAFKAAGNKRIQIYSFATSETGSESDARRISLTRALEIRAIMVAHNIDSRRIDIIAMGDSEASADAPATDRVDIVIGTPSGTL